MVEDSENALGGPVVEQEVIGKTPQASPNDRSISSLALITHDN